MSSQGAPDDWMIRILLIRDPLERIEKLKTAMGDDLSPQRNKEILFSIASSYAEISNFDEAERIYRNLLDTDPRSVVTMVSLSGLFLHYADRPEAALEWAEKAVETAFVEKVFLRLALGTKARVLLRMENYTELERIIGRVLEWDKNSLSVDVGKEWDFFQNADKSRLSEQIVRRVTATFRFYRR